MKKSQKKNGCNSSIEKDFNEYKLLSIKQSEEEILFERAVKTTIQILYEIELFDEKNNADETKDYLCYTKT